MNPSRARSRLNAYLEDDLSPRQRAKVEAALQASPELRSELAELRNTVALLRSLPRPETPPALASAVIARVRAGEAEPATLRNWLGGWLEVRYAVPIAAAALALVVFVDTRIGPAADAPAPQSQRVAEVQVESARLRPTIEVAVEMQELHRERLQRRVQRHGMARILSGAGHPHSAVFASDIDNAGDVALVGYGAR